MIWSWARSKARVMCCSDLEWCWRTRRWRLSGTGSRRGRIRSLWGRRTLWVAWSLWCSRYRKAGVQDSSEWVMSLSLHQWCSGAPADRHVQDGTGLLCWAGWRLGCLKEKSSLCENKHWKYITVRKSLKKSSHRIVWCTPSLPTISIFSISKLADILQDYEVTCLFTAEINTRCISELPVRRNVQWMVISHRLLFIHWRYLLKCFIINTVFNPCNIMGMDWD